MVQSIVINYFAARKLTPNLSIESKIKVYGSTAADHKNQTETILGGDLCLG